MDRLDLLYRHISPQLSIINSASTISAKFHRPRCRNLLNTELFSSLVTILRENPLKSLILSSTSPESFCLGFDMNSALENDLVLPEYFHQELTTIYFISKAIHSVALIEGEVRSSGCGLAMACKHRVVTESTRFSMPEAAFGLVPTSGLSSALTKLQRFSIGLYLMVTGQEITGIDCYWAGIATHFVSSTLISKLHDELLKGGDISSVLEKFASVPNPTESLLLRNLAEIEDVFSGVIAIDQILQRLASKSSKFAEDTFRRICQLCPLSLKVTVKNFSLASEKSYIECLERDYDISVQIAFRRSVNFYSKLKDKTKRTPWYPQDINEVTQEMVETILSNPEGPRLLLSGRL